MKKNLMHSAVSVAAVAAVVAAPGAAFATEGVPAASSETTVTAPAENGSAAEATDSAGTEAGSPTAQPGAAEGGAEAAAGDEIVTLDLYKLTDIHGHIEKVEKKDKKTGAVKIVEAGLAAVQCYLQKAETENANYSFTLLGDNIGASPFTSGSQKDNPTISALNLLPVLASTIGNHELDMGQQVFKQRVDGSNTAEFVKLNFPYLGANVDGMGTYTDSTGTHPYLGEYKVKEMAGVKVAYIGAIAQDVPFKLSPDTTKGLTFNDPIAKLGELAKKLKADKTADIVVAMLDDDVKNNYPLMPAEVDVIMGGDTHVPYEFDKLNSTVKLESKNPLLAGIASGSYTDNLGLVKIKYNKTTKQVVEADSILIPAPQVVEKAGADCLASSTVAAEVAKAVESAKEAGKAEIVNGVTAEFKRGLFLAPGEKEPGAGSNRGIESTLGNLVADSILDQVTVDGTKPVDIGVVNAGGLRADLLATNGVLTYADTFATLPFSNELGYAPMTGAQFKQALENQWKTDLNSQNSRPMLRMGTSSNLTYTYDATKPAGQRITSVLLNGKPLDMEKTYNVGSMTFVLHGGDGYFEKGLSVKTFGVLDRDGFNAYLKKMGGAALKASIIKRGVGITLPAKTVAKGKSISLPLRGLSFSEGPGKAEKVTVTVGAHKTTAAVENNLLEPNASNENSVVTTDGYGTATVEIDTVKACADLKGAQKLPVTVATNHGEVVSAAHGLTVGVDCGQAPKEKTPAKEDSNSGPTVGLEAKTVVEKGTIIGEGTGFTPGAEVEVYLHSTPIFLGTVTATKDGKVPFTFKVPAEVEKGTHHIVLTEKGSGKTARITVEIIGATVVPPASETTNTGSATGSAAKTNAPVKNVKKLANTGATTDALSLLALATALLGGALIVARKRA